MEMLLESYSLKQLLSDGIEVPEGSILNGKILAPEFQTGDVHLLYIILKNINSLDTACRRLAFRDYDKAMRIYKELYHKVRTIEANYPSFELSLQINAFTDGNLDILGKTWRIFSILQDWKAKQEELDKINK